MVNFLKRIKYFNEAHPNLTVFRDGFYSENLLNILLPIDKHVKIINASFFKKKNFWSVHYGVKLSNCVSWPKEQTTSWLFAIHLTGGVNIICTGGQLKKSYVNLSPTAC